MPSPFTANFDQKVRVALEKWHISGVSFSIVHNDDIWSKGYGLAQQQVPQIHVTPTTLFYAASTTKAHLCAVWALYIESEANRSKPKDQQISWSTPIADIIRDDFVLCDDRTTKVTLEDCVSHRTGLPRHESSYGYKGVRSVRDVTRNLRNLPMHHELRAKFEYCNTPYVAASHALEILTGKPLSQVLHEYLWVPLKMTHTYAGFREAASACVNARAELVAKSYSWTKLPCDPDDAKGKLVEDDYLDLEEVSGAGYVLTTADDYAKWMRALLNPGTAGNPITHEILQEVWKPRSINPPDYHDTAPFDGILTYGLGWFIGTYRGHQAYWHPGGIIGAGSLILLVPAMKWGVSFFSNGPAPSLTLKGLAFELLDDALGISESERTSSIKSDQSALEAFKKHAEAYSSALHRFYPNAPISPTVPLTLPLHEYTGTYHNLGYGPLRLDRPSSEGSSSKRKECLINSVNDRTWPHVLLFEHINAECWLVTMYSGATTSGKLEDMPNKIALKAESKIGVDGKVESFGVTMEPAMPDLLIWFYRGCNQ